jgi:hypothetical protein
MNTETVCQELVYNSNFDKWQRCLDCEDLDDEVRKSKSQSL